MDTGHRYIASSCHYCGKTLLIRDRSYKKINYCGKCSKALFFKRISDVNEICPHCKGIKIRRQVIDKDRQVYYCNSCKKTFIKTAELRIGGLNREKVTVICPNCKSTSLHRRGFYNNKQRYMCNGCGKTTYALKVI
jgi:transposase-like protein